jgi:hypothetical protein
MTPIAVELPSRAFVNDTFVPFITFLAFLSA